jgi:menaquinone-dependent protoporphyrinogen oxidase
MGRWLTLILRRASPGRQRGIMRVAIIFETLEGQTGKVACFAEKMALATGHQVFLINTSTPQPNVSLEGIARVVLAAPVHERRHPKGFEDFVTANVASLARRPTLMLSISLSAAFPESLEEASDFLEEMKMRTGFSPDEEVLVAGAIKPNGYDYFQAQVIRHNILLDRKLDLSGEEREFTDWAALEATLSAFLSEVPDSV